MARHQIEEEEKLLKAITLFSFPEGINWAPLTEYHRSVSDSTTVVDFCFITLPVSFFGGEAIRM